MSNSSVTVNLDGVSLKLKDNHDLDWLRNLGNVFCVFDQQDSGNLNFGIKKDGKKYFVKYAGANTLEYAGNPQDAILRLKQAIPLYKEIKHPHLIELIDHFAVGNGYVGIFEWFDGKCLHPHWSFPPPAKYNHPDSPYFQFKQLSIELRLDSLNTIFLFHMHVESRSHVAIDFYDGSILYDFRNNITKICDIDLYQKKPYINRMGRLWGSSRFMSPEEFELGAKIDERTNVFNMGAIAFGLIGGELDRSFSKWEAGKELFKVAIKAIDKNKDKRYSSVAEFYSAWQNAQ
jgi:serine/threonine-protein kinase